MSDSPVKASEQRGARVALRRLEKWAHENGLGEMAIHVEKFRRAHCPSPRVRAEVNGKKLYRHGWSMPSGQVLSREDVRAMDKAMRYADADGFVEVVEVVEEGLGDSGGLATGGQHRDASEQPEATVSSTTDSAPALTPAPREWWITISHLGHPKQVYSTKDEADRSLPWGGSVCWVREVRPLTAADVKALTEYIWQGTLLGPTPGAQAFAALKYLGIPVEPEALP